jgi:hypothetical protein
MIIKKIILIDKKKSISREEERKSIRIIAQFVVSNRSVYCKCNYPIKLDTVHS